MGLSAEAERFAQEGERALQARALRHAEDCFQHVLRLKPSSVHGLCGLAYLAWERERDVDAMRRLLQRAVRANPRSAAAHHLFAKCHLIRGDMVAAARSARKALACDPCFVHALATLDQADPVQPASRDHHRVLDMARSSKLTARNRAVCQFLAGRIFERGHDYDRAFTAYSQGNALSPGSFEAAGRMKNVADVTAGLCESHISAAIGQKAPNLIFIVGMFRSGSTLVEQILSQHSQTASVGEAVFAQHHFAGIFGPCPPTPLSPAAVAYRGSQLTPETITRFRTHYLTDAVAATGENVTIVDKNLHNFVLIPLIRQAFPEAQIIHCQRNSLDTAISIWSSNFSVRPFGNTLTSLSNFYRFYQQTIQMYEEYCTKNIINIFYEELAKDPNAMIPHLLRQLDLPFEQTCMHPEASENPVNTASVSQVRSTISTRSIGRARPFEHHLAPFVAGLADSSEIGGVALTRPDQMPRA